MTSRSAILQTSFLAFFGVRQGSTRPRAGRSRPAAPIVGSPSPQTSSPPPGERTGASVPDTCSAAVSPDIAFCGNVPETPRTIPPPRQDEPRVSLLAPFEGATGRGEAAAPREEGLLLGPPEPPPGWPVIAEPGPSAARPNTSAEQSPVGASPNIPATRGDDAGGDQRVPSTSTARVAATESPVSRTSAPAGGLQSVAQPLSVASSALPVVATESLVPRASAHSSPSPTGSPVAPALSAPPSFASSSLKKTGEPDGFASARFSSGSLGFGSRAEPAAEDPPRTPLLRVGARLAECPRNVMREPGDADTQMPVPVTAVPTQQDIVKPASVDPPRLEAEAHEGGERALPEERAADPGSTAPATAVPAADTELGPAAAPAPSHRTDRAEPDARKHVDLERCLLAFGNALQASHERNGRDVLHTVLNAQQEQLAMLMQALADQRLEYREQLERSIQGCGELLERAAKRLSDDLNPEAILQIGELFHGSAGQITGALARTERLSASMIEKQNRLLDGLGTLSEQLGKLLTVVIELRDLGHSIAGLPVPMSTQRAPPPERHLSLVAGRPDVLADIRDDLDNDDDA